MKTGHLLYLSGLNRETFNTLQRRGHLGFLDLHTGVTGEGMEGVDRFQPWHALALLAFVRLRAVGVEAGRAAEAVNDSWPQIIRVAGLIPEPPKQPLCGTRLNDIGIIDTWGRPHPKSKGGPPIAETSVDLLAAWADLKIQLTTILPANSAETELEG